MSLLKALLNETRKINEEDLFPDQGGAPDMAPTPEETGFASEESAEGEMVEPDVQEDIQITDELIADLTAENPAIAEVDPTEFREGLAIELEHFETVGGDMNIIAQIVLNHLNEFPGKNYYAALKAMEDGLREEEVVPTEEVPAEIPAEEPAFQEEEVVEEGKGKEALAQKTQTDGKALSQTKNESAVPGAETTPEEKKDEADIKKNDANTKKPAAQHISIDKANQTNDPQPKNPIKVALESKNPGKETTAEEKKVEKQEKEDAAKTKKEEAEDKAKNKAEDAKKNKNDAVKK